jgi:hypothetical protein
MNLQNFLLVLSFCATLINCHNIARIAGVSEHPSSNKSEFYAGVVESFEDFPHHVLFQPSTCGGSVISDHHVLTVGFLCIFLKIHFKFYFIKKDFQIMFQIFQI